jgi:hypothetical protein
MTGDDIATSALHIKIVKSWAPVAGTGCGPTPGHAAGEIG